MTPEKIIFKDEKLLIPDNPIIPFIEGDGIGPDIWSAAVQVIDRSIEILRLMGLDIFKDVLAKNLSHGYQKTLCIARTLAVKPKLLLLDEPATGLSQDKVEKIMGLVTRLREAGTTIVVIEHNMKAIMDYCDRIVVLAYGEKIADGLPREIKENTEVIEAYQGLMEENVR